MVLGMSEVKLYLGDCLEVMREIPNHSIDMVLCDLPYGTTACKWDVIIPFDELWKQYKRIIKDNGAILLFGKDIFSSKLILSNVNYYRYKWIWNKKLSGSFQNAKYQPLQIVEEICVFSKEKTNYYPIMRKGKLRKRGGAKETNRTMNKGFIKGYENYSDLYYPTNIIEYPRYRTDKLHPTQKPVALCEYLIKTYTNEGDTVLDNCMGSGTTGVACVNTGRKFIGIEKEEKYFEIAKKRIKEVEDATKLWR